MAQFASVRVQDWIARELHAYGPEAFIRDHPDYVADIVRQVRDTTTPPLRPNMRIRRAKTGPKRFVYAVNHIGSDGTVVLVREQGNWTHPDKPIGSVKIMRSDELIRRMEAGEFVQTV